MNPQTPSEVLEEAISDRALSRAERAEQTQKQCAARDAINLICFRTLIRAAGDGNEQCKSALVEINPHLETLGIAPIPTKPKSE